MLALITRIRGLVRDDKAQDLIEYAMLVALIALFCVGAVSAAGGRVAAIFQGIVAQIPA
jgi:Flp pilus assembly pilin Flp